jgi:hypothetical protein
LNALRKEIAEDMKRNKTFQYLLIQTEVDKLAQLYASFVSLAGSCSRSQTYLSQTDERDLARQIELQKSVQKSAQDPAVAAIAQKNSEVLAKRQATILEIQNFLARARGQMSLIENSVRLLRDQVLTMQSPDQLGDQLDDLITGVDAVQSSIRENEAILARVDAAPIEPLREEDTPGASRVRVR